MAAASIPLIVAAVTTAASTAQSIGTAKSTMQSQKRANSFARAKKQSEAAQAEKTRQENLRRALAANKAALAASGVDGTSQSALATVDQAFDQAQKQDKQQAANAITQSRTVSNAALNKSIIGALNNTNSLFTE